MSFGGSQASEPPVVAGVASVEVSSNQKARPVRWFSGLDWSPVDWIVSAIHDPEYVEKKQKVGKKTQTVGYEMYGTVAGIMCVGLLDQVTAIESSREIIWTGCVTRPDDPAHPDYWRATITTSYGTFYIYWGRRDQPVDDILLGRLGAADAALAHPAYRGQVLVVIKRYSFGSSETVPSTRILGRRVPLPALGTFPAQRSAQGESLPAAVLELCTNKLFGAGIPTDYFTAAQWEALSAAVISRAGCHSPYVDRERSIKELVKEAFGYFDGWARIDQAKIVPGLFPHDGSVPSGLPELSHHDMVGDPEIGGVGFSSQINSVRVKYRDANQKLREDSVGETARGNAKARQRTQPVEKSALWIIDNQQAGAYASEAAKSAAWGDSKGSFDVRGPRAVRSDGSPLLAGDNFQLDYLPLAVDQVCRVTKRVEPYRGPVSISYVGERGVFPLPYRAPESLSPDLGRSIPTVVSKQRLLELSPSLAGTTLGIYIALLAMRPPSGYENFVYLSGHGVIGFNLWYSADNLSYDPIGSQSTWGIRATVREAYGSAAGTVKVTLDADNLDTYKLSPRSAEDQADDALLLIVGNEVMSVGGISISGADWDLAVLRGRQETTAATAALSVEAWLVLRSDLVKFTHRRFVGEQTRWFKLQPYTSSQVTDLADVTAFSHQFSDQRPPVPAGLTASVGTGKAVNLKWTALVTSKVNEYCVYRATGSLFADEVKIADCSVPEYTDIRVTLGTEYRYRITSKSPNEIESNPSDGVLATPAVVGSTQIDHTLPAEAGLLVHLDQGTYLADDGAVVSWISFTVPAMPVRAVGQNILFRTGSTEWRVAAQVHNANATSLRIDDLAPGVSYEFGLQAFNYAGDPTAIKVTGTYTAPGRTSAPATPTGLTAIPGTGKSISLWWNANTDRDLDEYHVLRNSTNNPGSAVRIAEVRSNRFIDSEVVLGTLYYYWVVAANTSEVPSVFSNVAWATAEAVPDGQVDQTVPSAPGAPTLSSQGTYNSGDGTVFAYLNLSIPAMPSGAKFQNLLWRRSESSAWMIAGQVSNASGLVVPVDDLSPGISYDFALQARSFSGVPSALSSVLTLSAPQKTTTPSSISGLAIASAAPHVNPKLIGSTGKYAFQGCEVTWIIPTQKDVVSVEWKRSGGIDSPGVVYPPYYVDGVAQEGLVPSTQNWLVLYKQSGQSDGYVSVRPIDSSGNYADWQTLSLSGAFYSTAGSMALQDSTATAVSGIQIGSASASSVRKVLAVFDDSAVWLLAGGAPSERQNLSLSNRGFSTKPDIGIIQCTSSTNILATYDWGDAGSSSTNAVILFYTRDGSALGNEYHRFSVSLKEYD
jgi:hypothetical protein